MQSDLVPPSRGSQIRDKYPNSTEMTVSELLGAMMGVSDGTASDILLKLAGGPERVTGYIEGLGVRGIEVATAERAMAHGEQVQCRNWAVPELGSAGTGQCRTRWRACCALCKRGMGFRLPVGAGCSA